MVGCAVLHLVSLAVAPPTSGLAALLLLGMAFACLPCATRAAMAPTRRTWLHAGTVSIAMLAAHPFVGLLSSGHAMHAHVVADAGVLTLGLTLGPLLSLCLSGYAAWVTAASA